MWIIKILMRMYCKIMSMKVVFESWRIQELPAPMHASRACREHTQMRLVLKWGQISFKSRHVLCVPLLYPICGCGAFYDYKLATNTSKCVNLYPCLAYRVRQLVEPMIVFLNFRVMVSVYWSDHPFQAPLAAFHVQLGSTLTSQAWTRTRFHSLYTFCCM